MSKVCRSSHFQLALAEAEEKYVRRLRATVETGDVGELWQRLHPS